jgi:transketolase
MTGAAELIRLAADCRHTLLEMVHLAASGHVGSSLSCVDILTVLEFDQLDRAGGDVLVLSKGHAAPAWYAVLLVAGRLDPQLLKALRVLDSPLQGHPDRTRLPLVEVSTGALGQGLSVAVGRAEAKRLRGSGAVAYCVAGDGELQEGQMWESVMYAGSRGLGNIVLVVDSNGSQNDGPLALPIDAAAVFGSFGWYVRQTDGHAVEDLRTSLAAARAERDRPSIVLARTQKGRLAPGHVAMGGVHSGVLGPSEYADAVSHLRSEQ